MNLFGLESGGLNEEREIRKGGEDALFMLDWNQGTPKSDSSNLKHTHLYVLVLALSGGFHRDGSTLYGRACCDSDSGWGGSRLRYGQISSCTSSQQF